MIDTKHCQPMTSAAPTPPSPTPPSPTPPDSINAYLVMEQPQRRDEIERFVERVERDQRYGLLTTGLIWAWLATNREVLVVPFDTIASMVPTAIMIFFLVRWQAFDAAIVQVAKYMEGVEAKLGLSSPYGWESFLTKVREDSGKSRSLLARSTLAFWWGLIGVNVLLAVAFWWFGGIKMVHEIKVLGQPATCNGRRELISCEAPDPGNAARQCPVRPFQPGLGIAGRSRATDGEHSARSGWGADGRERPRYQSAAHPRLPCDVHSRRDTRSIPERPRAARHRPPPFQPTIAIQPEARLASAPRHAPSLVMQYCSPTPTSNSMACWSGRRCCRVQPA